MNDKLIKYWYKFYIRECVDCGRNNKWKERQFTPKPNDSCYEYQQYLCENCKGG